MKRRDFLSTTAAALTFAAFGGPVLAQDAPAVPDMVLGNPDAKVTVIEYASFTCPHCSNFAGNQFKQIKANYIDTGLVKFIFREVYFDRFGLWASMIARCGGDMRFFGITEMLFERQTEWAAGEPAAIAANLRAIGKSAGLDDASLDACMADADQAQALVNWYEENRQADNIEGTPQFKVQDVKYSNMSYEEFAKVLDEALIAAGVEAPKSE